MLGKIDMSTDAEGLSVFDKLDNSEKEMVISFASSLIRNRQEHRSDYQRFQEIRNKMVKKNPMSMEEIDRIIHS